MRAVAEVLRCACAGEGEGGDAGRAEEAREAGAQAGEKAEPHCVQMKAESLPVVILACGECMMTAQHTS